MAISVPSESIVAAPARSLAGLTDSELVAEVRCGSNELAFEQLYGRYHRRISVFVYRMVGDYGRAEDIAQEVFMSALRRMEDTDRPITFKPWIYEIARNACIDEFRRAGRAKEVSYDADEGLGSADHCRLACAGPAPDVAVDQKMAIDYLRGAFGGLSQTHHEILVMREFEGLSYREIGARLGMSRPSVESTLFRARRRLGEEYEELVSGERCLRVQSIIAAASAAVPGARDQRRLAVHLSHCQPCRRHAKVAGLDAAALVAPRGKRAKIAALFPLPAFLRRRWFGEEVAAPLATNHHVTALAHLSTSVDPVIASWAKAVVAAAMVAAGGVAGGAAVSGETRPGLGVPAPAAPSSGTPPKAAAPARPAAVPPAPKTAERAARQAQTRSVTPTSRRLAGGGAVRPPAGGPLAGAARPSAGAPPGGAVRLPDAVPPAPSIFAPAPLALPAAPSAVPLSLIHI